MQRKQTIMALNQELSRRAVNSLLSVYDFKYHYFICAMKRHNNQLISLIDLDVYDLARVKSIVRSDYAKGFLHPELIHECGPVTAAEIVRWLKE